MLTLGAFGDIQLMWLAVNLGYILYFFDEMPPWIVAVASICGTQTHVQIFATDGHRASARAVCVLQLVSPLIAVLFVLLSASIRPGCIAHMYLIQLSWYLQGFQNSRPWIVARLSDWENMVCNTWARGSGSAMYTVGISDLWLRQWAWGHTCTPYKCWYTYIMYDPDIKVGLNIMYSVWPGH